MFRPQIQQPFVSAQTRKIPRPRLVLPSVDYGMNFAVTSYNMSSYWTKVDELKIDQISKDRIKIHLVNDEHVKNLMQSLRQNRYKPLTSWFITVAVSRSRNPLRTATRHELLSNDENIPDGREMYLVNGQHRVKSLQKLLEQDENIIEMDQIFHENGVIQVTFFYRTDDVDIS